jgi:SAM-dependent methyltransferase
VPESDEENLELASSPRDVDALNKAFYGRFPYPWPPQTFPLIADRQLERAMLNQSVGAWGQERIPAKPDIWVAGCGTNQAIYTALKFPDAAIVASDISVSSLEISRKTAAALGLTNIAFRQESLNDVGYEAQFDYIVCTGVIHHNAEPGKPLERLSRALRRDGVLELMVYNRFHRLLRTGVQKAVRIFSRAAGQEADFDAEFGIAKSIIDAGPLGPMVRDSFRHSSDAEFADAWLQPVEYSYTIESLAELAGSCDLRLLLPCLTHFDYANQVVSWDTAFDDPALQARYDRLDDADRWQVGNLLLGGRSPMLWFYLGKTEAGDPENLEQVIWRQFLEQRFERVQTQARSYRREPDGRYQLSLNAIPHPPLPASPLIRAVVERANPGRAMGDILTSLGVDVANRRLVNEIRIETTSPLCPYLKAVV